MKLNFLGGLVAALAMLAGPVLAQQAVRYQSADNVTSPVAPATPLPVVQAFAPVASATLALSTSSDRVALPSSDQTAIVTNTGSVTAYIKLGSASVTAATTDFAIPAGVSIALRPGTNTYIAGIVGSGTGSLAITTGTGSAAMGGGGGGSGSSGTEFPEDAGHSSGANGTLVFCVRRDTAASSAGTDIDYATFNCDNTGRLWTHDPLAESLLTDIRTAVQDTSTEQPVNLKSATTGGCTIHYATSAASTNATNVKASAGTLCGGTVINTTATLYYLRFYNLASSPTCSSSTGFVATFPIPASTSGNGTVIDFGTFGAALGTGIGYCLTGGGSSTDNTNAATGVYINLGYK
jgi:hypothetical protein